MVQSISGEVRRSIQSRHWCELPQSRLVRKASSSVLRLITQEFNRNAYHDHASCKRHVSKHFHGNRSFVSLMTFNTHLGGMGT